VLYREPMWLKCTCAIHGSNNAAVSVLYREPMWLKCTQLLVAADGTIGFSALP